MDGQLPRSKQSLDIPATKIIWHWCSNRWYSAITDYAFSAIKSLNQFGYENLLFLPAKSAASDVANHLSINHQVLTSFRAAPLKLYYSTRPELRPSVIFCYGGPETFASHLLPKSTKIIRFRGDYPRGLAARFAFRKIPVVYPSNKLRNDLSGSDDSSMHLTVPLGRDGSMFHPPDSAHFAPQNPTLLIVGRMDPVKGHREFSRLFAKVSSRLKRERPEIQPLLKIIGESKNVTAAELRDYFGKSSLVEGVDYRISEGRAENIGDEMRQATLGIIPSIGSELIVRVAEEFLMCGVPIFTSGVGSLDEVSKRADCWSYLDLSTREAEDLLFHAIIKSTEESHSERLIRAEKAHGDYSIKVMGQQLDQLVQKLLK